MAVKPIPDGYNTLTPFCALERCADAIETYRKVFGAELRMRFDNPDGTVAHCELRFGDSIAMMGEASKEVPVHNMRLMMYVADCDAIYRRALSAGFTSKQPPADQFYGDRNARVVDPFGNEWYVSTHIEDVSEEEMKKRMQKLGGG